MECLFFILNTIQMTVVRTKKSHLSSDTARQEVDLMQVINFSTLHTKGNKITFASRRLTRGYSLTDSQKEAVDLSPSDFGNNGTSDIKQ